jgi:mycothiol S-conjugate amidase
MGVSPLDAAGEPLTLLSVHAHPDDEASKGAGTVAKYHAEGIRSVLVCCTGGEEGEILNPHADTPEVREHLSEVRAAELQASVDAIGYDALHLLGYRDSGMAGAESNQHPDCFAQAPLDEAVERLVRIIRAERPHVIITYPDEQQWYAHPDHLRVHEISGPAFDAAGDPTRFPGAGPAWQPQKLYWSGFSFRRIVALHDAYVKLGEESPYAERVAKFPADAVHVVPSTLIDVGDHLHVRRAALLAHRTQIDPDSHWMRVPDALIREAYPWDEYQLARSLVDTGVPEGDSETDLFAGLRVHAGVRGRVSGGADE